MLKRIICFLVGHRVDFKHPQQEACECSRCRWLIGHFGEIVAPPLRPGADWHQGGTGI